MRAANKNSHYPLRRINCLLPAIDSPSVPASLSGFCSRFNAFPQTNVGGIWDGIPFLQRLRLASVNAPLGVALDLLFEIIMGVLLVLLAPVLPCGRMMKGASDRKLAVLNCRSSGRQAIGVSATGRNFR
jgi:hypothetical protein